MILYHMAYVDGLHGHDYSFVHGLCDTCGVWEEKHNLYSFQVLDDRVSSAVVDDQHNFPLLLAQLLVLVTDPVCKYGSCHP